MITDARNPKWIDAAHSAVDLEIEHAQYGWIPFTASPNDPEEHGRVLHAAAVAGEFGLIAEYVAPVETPEQVQQRMVAAVQRHLDATARARNYDGILSLASYATSTHPPFAAEGRAGADWRDSVWGYCYQILADVQAGRRTIPTEDQLIAELPIMVWPT